MKASSLSSWFAALHNEHLGTSGNSASLILLQSSHPESCGGKNSRLCSRKPFEFRVNNLA
jgi:hypothetical protein